MCDSNVYSVCSMDQKITNPDLSGWLSESVADRSEEEIAQSLQNFPTELRELLLSHLIDIKNNNAALTSGRDLVDTTSLEGNDTVVRSACSLLEEPKVPGLIGPYCLLEKIGQGGMGTVWRSQQTKPIRRQLAVKVIRTDRDRKATIGRFRSEQQVLALLNHPNIARIVDAGQTDEGRLYFAMELVDGQPLTTYCDRHNLSVEQRLLIFLDICDAIQHAHQKGIIHRDLKPTNILITEIDDKPVPKVIDFGLAKILEGERPLTQENVTLAGQLLGTLRYMSPEQAGGKKDEVDSRSDIYSLGAILYEMLAGETPMGLEFVKKESLAEVLEAIRLKDPDPPSVRLVKNANTNSEVIVNRNIDRSSLTRMLTSDLDWISMKALDKDMERRYASVSELANDLRRFLNGEPVSARPPSQTYRVKKFIGKNRIVVTAFCLVGLALMMGLVGTSWGWKSANAANVLANLRLDQVKQAQKNEANRAAGERQAKLQVERQLGQIRQTNNIMREIFNDLDIYKIKKSDEPLEAVLAKRLVKAADQLNQEFLGGPTEDLVQMQLGLATALRSLGFPNEALKLNRLAHERCVEFFGADDWETGRSGKMLADGLIELGQLKEALPYYENYFQACLLRDGLENKDTLSVMHSLAVLAKKSNDPQKAIGLLEQVIPLRTELLGEDSLKTITSVNVLATAYDDAGILELAIKTGQKAVRMREQVLGEDAMPTLVSMNNLAGYYKSAGQYTLALETLEKAVRLMSDGVGEEHPSTQALMLNLANYYIENDDKERAVETLQKTHRLMKKRLGDAHPHTMIAEAKLAFLFMDDPNRYNDSLEIYQRLYQVAKDQLGTKHTSTQWHIGNLATVHAKLGNMDRALELGRERIEICRSQLGEKNPTTLNAQLSLVSHLLKDEQLEKALEEVDRVLQATETLDDQSKIVRDAKHQAAEVHEALGQTGEALVLWQALLAQTRDSHGDSHAKTYRLMTRLAGCYGKLDQWQEAVKLYRESFQQRQKNLPDDWNTSQAQVNLGLALLENQDPEQAAGLLDTGILALLEKEATLPGSEGPDLERDMKHAIRVYRQLGATDEAKQWQARLDAYLN